MFQDLCQRVHKDLLAGTCPWCGCGIIKAQVCSLPHRRLISGQVCSLPLQRTSPGFSAVHIFVLIELLKYEEFRCKAANALGELGPDAKIAVPVLTELLNDKNEEIRKAAREALEKIKREK